MRNAYRTKEPQSENSAALIIHFRLLTLQLAKKLV